MDDTYKTSDLFNDRDRAAIAWAEAMTNNTAQRDGAVWDAMKSQFDETEIVEISMASAMFNMINRLNDGFWTELETEDYNRKQWEAVEGPSVDEIEAYAGRFAAVGAAERA